MSLVGLGADIPADTLEEHEERDPVLVRQVLDEAAEAVLVAI